MLFAVSQDTMPPTPPVCAAQYLRISTEHQQYSLDNQAEAIQRYAEGYGFVVVKTYADAGKSGLILKHRTGLSQLLQDVVSGSQDYGAILVYDVSRWGRFQDADEAAHYEFLCKRAGIHVHYCAEPFANDGTVSSSILKALKRSMAEEYSRELGVKVYAGKKRLVQLGFSGQAGYGLRRMLLSADGKRKQRLGDGERKSLLTDRVVLVPGPKREVECVRLMFRMGLRKSYRAIAQELNSRGIPHLRSKPWTADRVQEVLTNPKYAGCNVWGRTSAKLRSRPRRTDPEQWIISPTPFKPLVDQRTFDRLQAAHPNKRLATPEKVLLEKLRGLLASVGKLSKSIVLESPGVPDAAFELVGYGLSSAQLRISEQAGRRHHLQEMLIAQIDRLFPNQARVRFVRNRSVFSLGDGAFAVPSTICEFYRTRVQKTPRWALRVPRTDRHLTTLLCLPNWNCRGFKAFYIVHGIEMGTRYNITGEGDPLLQRGQRLNSLADLCTVGQSLVQAAGQSAESVRAGH